MTLRRWRKAGKLPSINIGRQVRFAITDVEAFETKERERAILLVQPIPSCTTIQPSPIP